MPIRVRLALWYGALLTLILLVFGLVLYVGLQAHLWQALDQSVERHARHFGEALATAPAESDAVQTLMQAFEAPDTFVVISDLSGRILVESPAARRLWRMQPPEAVVERLSRAAQRLTPHEVARSLGDRPVDLQVSRSLEALIATRLLYSDQLRGEQAPGGQAGGGQAEGGGGQARVNEATGAVPVRDDHLRVIAQLVPAPNAISPDEPVIAFTALSFAESRGLLRQLLRFLAAGILLSALLAVSAGWTLAASALRPVATMTDTARAIARSGGFSRRLPVEGLQDELGRLAVAFNEMLAALDRSLQNQKRFVADASHELRAPLTTLRGNLDLLERAKELPESERQAMIEDMRGEVQRLSRLVADLLALAQADAGQSLRLQETELDRLVVETFRTFRVQGARHRMAITKLEPVTLQCDPDRVRQVLVILLDNAIQYTPPGGRIEVRLQRAGWWAELEVADTGIGIEPEEIPLIFERFYRVDKARSRASGGTGLGLSIAKWVVEAHGGEIRVESKPGVGSRFIVRLPASEERQER